MKQIVFSILFLMGLFAGMHAQNYTPSDADSKVSFVIKNMGLDVDGTLKGLKGKIIFNPKSLATSQFDVTVEVNTINTDNTKRDNHLKNSDFFDAEKYPVIHIKSTKILPKGGDKYFAQAILTMHGVSKNIQFDFIATPKADGILLTANFPLNRRDYNIGKASMTMADNLSVRLSILGKK